MKVVTVINDQRNFHFNLLKLSCALNSLQLIVLVTKDNFRSRRVKDDMLISYLEDIDEDEIVLFTDGFDAIFVSGESEILEKFNKMNMELIFSAESACWPDKSLAENFPLCDTDYQYLNSGGFIGKAGIIKKLLKDNDFDIENYVNSNQYIWIKRFFKYPEKIGLDTKCEIFQTFSPEIGSSALHTENKGSFLNYYTLMKQWFRNNFLIEDGRIFSKITNTFPCHAHFNGNSKLLIDDQIIKLVNEKIPGFKDITVYHEVN